MAAPDPTPRLALLVEPPGDEARVIALAPCLLRPLECIAAAGPAGLRDDPILRCQVAELRKAGVPIISEGGRARLGAAIQRLRPSQVGGEGDAET